VSPDRKKPFSWVLLFCGLFLLLGVPSTFISPVSSVALADVAASVTSSVDVREVATTQAEVGYTAVTKMMLYWAGKAQGSPE
jgi:hypothetical protein